MIHGRNLILAIGGTALAGSKSCSVDVQQSFFPVASPTSGRWEESVPERLNWKITSEGLLVAAADYNTLLNAQRNGTKLTIRYYDSTYGINQTGSAYIESLSINGAVGSLTRCSVSLRGTGSLTNYEGETITPRLLVQELGWYYDDTGQGSYDPIDEENGLVQGLQFTLNEATTVRFYPYDTQIMLGTSSLIVAIQDKETIEESVEYDAVIYQTTDLQLAAGTYYICFNFKDDAMDTPKLVNLGS